jgi:hypothetical protein
LRKGWPVASSRSLSWPHLLRHAADDVDDDDDDDDDESPPTWLEFNPERAVTLWALHTEDRVSN